MVPGLGEVDRLVVVLRVVEVPGAVEGLEFVGLIYHY